MWRVPIIGWSSISGRNGERAVVSREALARQFPNELDRTLDLLTRRELIESADGGYRFQVELIQRWFTRSRIDSQNM